MSVMVAARMAIMAGLIPNAKIPPSPSPNAGDGTAFNLCQLPISRLRCFPGLSGKTALLHWPD